MKWIRPLHLYPAAQKKDGGDIGSSGFDIEHAMAPFRAVYWVVGRLNSGSDPWVWEDPTSFGHIHDASASSCLLFPAKEFAVGY